MPHFLGERWAAAQACLGRCPKPRKGFHPLTRPRFALGYAIVAFWRFFMGKSNVRGRWAAAQACLGRCPKPCKGFHPLTRPRFAPGCAIGAFWRFFMGKSNVRGTLGCRPNLLGALPQTPQGISSLDPSALRARLRGCAAKHRAVLVETARCMDRLCVFTGTAPAADASSRRSPAA